MQSQDRHIVERYISRDLQLLHPQARIAFSEFAIDLSNENLRGNTETNFRVFEGYRSPIRQAYLYDSKPRVTQAEPWESAHNFGFAVDFVPWIFRDGKWQWSWDDEHDWAFLKERAKIFGLDVPITWDRGHVQHPVWDKIKWYIRNATEQ